MLVPRTTAEHIPKWSFSGWDIRLRKALLVSSSASRFTTPGHTQAASRCMGAAAPRMGASIRIKADAENPVKILCAAKEHKST